MDMEMLQIEPYFLPVADALIKNAPAGDLQFALVTDSHLGDTRSHTCANIRYIDKQLHFDCVIHMGDFLCGNVPSLTSQRLLNDEIAAFQNSVNNRRLFVAQGNHDGYSDECYKNGTFNCRDIALDEAWYDATCFMDADQDFQRPEQKPYYFVDFPAQKLRMIVLCTNWYEMDQAHGIYRKRYGLDSEQIHWLAEKALHVPESEWNIILFSHIAVLKNGGRCIGTVYHHGGLEAMELVKAFRDGGTVLACGRLYSFTKQGHHVLAWCNGDGHGDMICHQNGMDFIGIASSLAVVPVTWDQQLGYYPAPRAIGTAWEDAWDAVVWQKKEQKLTFLRFGAGQSREVLYQ